MQPPMERRESDYTPSMSSCDDALASSEPNPARDASGVPEILDPDDWHRWVDSFHRGDFARYRAGHPGALEELMRSPLGHPDGPAPPLEYADAIRLPQPTASEEAPRVARRKRNGALRRHNFVKVHDRPILHRLMRHARSVFRVPVVIVYLPSLADKDMSLVLMDDKPVRAHRLSRRAAAACINGAEGLDLVVNEDTERARTSTSFLLSHSGLGLASHSLADRAFRFFASAPIVLSTPSIEVGAVEERVPCGRLCILDYAPRTFQESDREVLWEEAVLMSEYLEYDYRRVQGQRAKRVQLTLAFLGATVDNPASLASAREQILDAWDDTLSTRMPRTIGGDEIPFTPHREKLEELAFQARAKFMCQSLRSTLQATAAFVVDVSNLCTSTPLQAYLNRDRARSHCSAQGTPSDATPVNEFDLCVSDNDIEQVLPRLLAYDGPEEGKPNVATVAAARELGQLLPGVLSDSNVRFFDARKTKFPSDPSLGEGEQWLPSSPAMSSSNGGLSLPCSPISGSSPLGGRVGESNPIPGLLASNSCLSSATMVAALPVCSIDRMRVHIFFLTFRELVAFDDMDFLLFQGTSDIYQASIVRQEARSASDAQLRFIQGVQHELRTPLHGLLGAAELLHVLISNKMLASEAEREGSSTDEFILRLANTLTLSATSLSELLDDVLDFGKVTGIRQEGQTGAQATEAVQPTDISSLVSDIALEEFEKAQLERRTKALTDKEFALPQLLVSATEEVRHFSWEVASGTLRKIIQKILSNSLRFTWEGTIDVHLATISAPGEAQEDDGNWAASTAHLGPSTGAPSVSPLEVKPKIAPTIELTIADTGLGMSANFLRDGLLKPFVKHSTFRPGVGLGIPLALGLIEQLDGQVRVQSELGRGTKVTIRLPLRRAEPLEVPDMWSRHRHFPITREPEASPVTFAFASDLGRTGTAIRQFLLTGPCQEVSLAEADLVIAAAGGNPEAAATAAAEMKKTARVALVCRETDRPVDTSPFVGHALHRVRPPWVWSSRAALRDFVLDPKPFALQPPPLSRRHTAPGVPRELPTTTAPPPAPPPELQRASGLPTPLKPSLRSPLLLSPLQEPYSPSPDSPLSTTSVPPDTPAQFALSPSVHQPATKKRSLSFVPPPTPAITNASATPLALPSVRHPAPAPAPAPPLERRWASALALPFTPVPMSASKSKSESQLRPITSGAQRRSALARPTSPLAVSLPMPTPPSDSAEEALLRAAPMDLVPSVGSQDHPAEFRVLVVEDNPINMRLLTNCVKRLGLPYDEAKDGAEAVAKFQLFQPQVVLLDMSLPLKDGFEAAAEMRRLPQPAAGQARIIAITALSDSRDRARGLTECGINEWRTKPVSIRKLQENLTDWHTAWLAEQHT